MFVRLVLLVIRIVCILLAVAFITLFERHLLRISHNRLGPNKVVIFGVVQPILDGIKLLSKQNLRFYRVFIFMAGPSIAFLVIFLEWMVLPLGFSFINFKTSRIFFLCCIGIIVYTTLLSGISRGRKFGFIGSIRASCQTVRYEVAIVLIILVVLSNQHSYEFSSISS